MKKVISFIIALSIILGAVCSSYALSSSTPSSIVLNRVDLDTAPLTSVSSSAEIKATSPSTTVEPEDSSSAYYYLGSTGNQTSSTGTVSTWSNIVQFITYSISYTGKALHTVLSNVLSTLNNINNTSSFSWSTFYNWSAQSGVYSSSVSGSANLVSALANMIGRLSYIQSNQVEQLYQTGLSVQNIESILTSGSAIEEVKIKDNSDNGFNQSYLWNKTSLSGIYWLGENYQKQTQSYGSDWSLFGQILYNLYFFNRSLSNLGVKLESDVYASLGPLTNSDLSTSNLGYHSIWYDIRSIGSNLSNHLARLDFVLASDEEIAARQAASANQDQVVDDFISSSGSASASTSDFADVASAGSQIKNALDSNVSINNAFSAFDSSSSAWDWFSQSIADSLDSTSSSRKGGSSTPYLDSYYSDLQKILMVKDESR